MQLDCHFVFVIITILSPLNCSDLVKEKKMSLNTLGFNEDISTFAGKPFNEKLSAYLNYIDTIV